MAQMRAVLIKDDKGPIENLYVGETTKPTPGPGQVLVKIKAFGLNRMDVHQREGKYPPPQGASIILGVEFSGTVAELGRDVTDWNIDDEVLGLAGGGAYAEYILVSQKLLLKKPTHLSWVQAASIPEVFLTAFLALVMIGDLKPNDNVLLHGGASGVGIAAIQLAHVYGAKTITATASSKYKLDWLQSIQNGATHVVNYKTQDFAAEVKKTTGGKGVDVIIDIVGQSHFVKNIDALAVDGRMTMLGLLSGGVVQEFNLSQILFKRLRIQGSTLRARSLEFQAELIKRFGHEVLDKITGHEDQGPIKTYVHRVYPWAEIQAAHKEMEEDKNIGKIVIEVV